MTKPASFAALLLLASSTTAWMVGPALLTSRSSVILVPHHNCHDSPAPRCRSNTPLRQQSVLAMAVVVELEPEPEGGTALQPFTSMAGCRMKQLDDSTVKTTNTENKEPAYKFWMTGQAEVHSLSPNHAQRCLISVGGSVYPFCQVD